MVPLGRFLKYSVLVPSGSIPESTMSGEAASTKFKCNKCKKMFPSQYRLSKHKLEEGHQETEKGGRKRSGK